MTRQDELMDNNSITYMVKTYCDVDNNICEIFNFKNTSQTFVNVQNDDMN